LSFSSLSYGQFWSDFEDGTLQGFTNGDGTTEQLFVHQEAGSHFLQKDCDGSNSALGEMMIINTEQWIGNYFYSPTGDDMAMRGIDEIYIRNENDFDIHLRVGFTGSNGYQVVSTLPTIIPAFSDWNFYNLPYYVDFPTISNLTIINNVDGIPFLELFNHIHDLFEDVVEIRFFHNEEESFNPQTVIGSLQIDDIYSYQLLNNTDNSLSKVRLYPNPVSSNLMVQIPNAIQAEVIVYNVLGDKVKSQTLDNVRTSLDLSALQSGIYLVKISSETETITKKIIKD
ncbi:MAG: T9SS type A sorting domain-containing protein, partial [Flavobacteriaceae bacterium]|nr:T9SS type A sorting domain-containing protein [Flavobacteriaceae bacterium]